MSAARTPTPMDLLLERLRADGGRYLLSVALTREERDAQPPPTFGSKGHSRWLTEEEHAALRKALDACNSHDALVAALDSIERYGLDTMSGPMESPPDLAAWYRYGVNEMVRRARAALKAARGES